MSRVPRGLYAITPQRLCEDEAALLQAADAALRGGAVMLQYRDKEGPPERRLAQALALRALCNRYEARLIINDDVQLAENCGADGVHLGRADGSIAEARARLGREALIGASCGPDLARAHTVLAEGADHVAFGRFYPSRTKPDAPQADIELLATARRDLRAPICVIGGITPMLARELVALGADLIAAVEGVFGADDIATAARAYATLYA
jgi:thiamine-phosphate pyrophosphorylase